MENENVFMYSKIYKIEPTVEHPENDIYIGATSRPYLKERFLRHKTTYNGYKNGKHNRKVTSYYLFDKYGIENCTIVLLEAFPCNTRDELNKREGHYIRTLPCVNKKIEGRTQKEYYIDNKEKIKLYCEANVERIKAYCNEHKAQRKVNYDRYRQKHNDKFTTVTKCACGMSHLISHTNKHVKTKKHQAHLKLLNI